MPTAHNPVAVVVVTTGSGDTDQRLDELEAQVEALVLPGDGTTAEDLLEAIKTVDGPGSGLDADTLQGSAASDFAAANHAHSTLLPKVDVLNESDMASNSTTKPPSQASVREYVTDGLADKVTAADILIDEDDMVSDLTTKAPTQSSVKAYVENALTGELIRDIIGAAMTSGTGVTVTVSDAGETITISADPEFIRDTIDSAVSAGTGVTVTVDDSSNTLTIAASAEYIRDTIAATLVAGSNMTITPNDGADTITLSAASGGGGVGDAVYPWHFVTQSGGQTIGLNPGGGVISQLATSAANNATVIQAVIDAAAGSYSPGTAGTLGHGGGSTVMLSAHQYEISTTIELKYGVSLAGGGTSLDRNGFSSVSHSFQGTTLSPTSALPSIDVHTGATTTTKRPVILVGRLADGSTQSTTNPHGISISGLTINMERATTAQGILICNTQYVNIRDCSFGDASGTNGCGIEILSTISPDDGAHGNRIHNVWMVSCATGIRAGGSGSTDSLVTDTYISSHTQYAIDLGSTGGGGGWQISGCHFTGAVGDMDTGDLAHVRVAGAPTMISSTYFDTGGGWSIYVESGALIITGCYFKCNNARGAPIYLSNTSALKSTITGNMMFCDSGSIVGLVKVDSTSSSSFRTVVTGNLLMNPSGVQQLLGAVINASNVGVAENNAAMSLSNTTAQPYIYGNRVIDAAL
jgi:hypothetical protein